MTDSSIDERAPLIFHTSYVQPSIDNRTHFQRRLAVWLILLAVGFERLAFYSLAGNLVLFLSSNTIHWSSLNSITASLSFFGASYVSALLFSWISDAKLGRAKTILIGLVLYVIGYVFIPVFSKKDIFTKLCDERPEHKNGSSKYWDEQCSIKITAVLAVTAIGVGAVQANMAIFGAEQLRDKRDITQYFNKYYASVNIGGLLAFSIISYVQQNFNWFRGHVISTALLGVTWLVFLIGYKYYIHIKPCDSVITNFFPVLMNAFRTRRKYRQHARRLVNERRSANQLTPLREQESHKTNDTSSYEIDEGSISFIDYAKIVNYGRFHDHIVDDIKAFRRIIVVFLLLTPYWIIYLQSDTTFVVQAVHMRVPSLKFISEEHNMPVIWLSLADQLVIIVAIFILNACVYKRLHASNRKFSMEVRLIIGMVIATLSMCIAGIVEVIRQERCGPNYQQRIQSIGNANFTAADMWVFYQFPQYLTIGLSEVFTSVASMEFAYLAAPESAQSLVMSLRFCSAGLSSFIGSGYVTIFKSIHPNFGMKHDECKSAEKPTLFYIYFFVLAGIQLLFILIFLGCNRKFEILKVSQHRFNTRLFIGSNPTTSNT